MIIKAGYLNLAAISKCMYDFIDWIISEYSFNMNHKVLVTVSCRTISPRAV